MTDLSFRRQYRHTLVTPCTEKGSSFLSDKMWCGGNYNLDKPVTLSLDGAIELDTLARGEGLETDGL